MKVTLDLDKLLHEGKIGRQEYEVLKGTARSETTSLALNIFLGFGIVAVSVGLVAAMASAGASILIGVIAVVGGVVLRLMSEERWGSLGSILIVVGALIFGGGTIAFSDGSTSGFLMMTVIYGVVGLACGSGLMVGLSAISLFGAIGAVSSYSHARYSFGTSTPLLTIIIFSGLAAGSNWLLKQMDPADTRMLNVYARMCLILANVGFWVGTLWGDNLFGPADYDSAAQATLPGGLFALVWAGALIGLGIWANRNSQRWALNVAAVFGGIHLYTQWFEWMGASPISLLVAGLVALLAAYIIIAVNRDLAARQRFVPRV